MSNINFDALLVNPSIEKIHVNWDSQQHETIINGKPRIGGFTRSFKEEFRIANHGDEFFATVHGTKNFQYTYTANGDFIERIDGKPNISIEVPEGCNANAVKQLLESKDQISYFYL